MKASLTALALFTALTFGGGLVRAEDQAPVAAPPAVAPADSAPKAVEPAAGCMPDGSCCGHGACAHAAASAEKAANGAVLGDAEGTAGSNAADSGGGCPCSKMKKKAM
jgi:hypothetical protein